MKTHHFKVRRILCTSCSPQHLELFFSSSFPLRCCNCSSTRYTGHTKLYICPSRKHHVHQLQFHEEGTICFLFLFLFFYDCDASQNNLRLPRTVVATAPLVSEHNRAAMQHAPPVETRREPAKEETRSDSPHRRAPQQLPSIGSQLR